ncbi:glycosyl transferase family 90-domain-containing protein [Mycena galopus ATCC 62051]|nr:glycosyl transferase family 90-domain-containing protein [Mycena galopus ATCC 62051]
MRIDDLYSKQSATLEQAIARYTSRNNRPPPPNFDKWFDLAREKKCLIDEDEQIHRDFAPFYQLAEENPAHFQTMVDLGRALVIHFHSLGRGYIAEFRHFQMLQDPKGMATVKIMGGEFVHILPDMDFLINGRDEPRVVFNARDSAVMKTAMELKDSNPFQLRPNGLTINAIEDVACEYNFVLPAVSHISTVIRSSSSSDFTTDLWPLLSMTKISPCFSDILYPGSYYYDSSKWSGKFSHANDIPWDNKTSELYWRGEANGGHIYRDNFHKFSRFRLVKIAQNHTDIINARITTFRNSHCTNDCERGPIIAEYNISGRGSPREEVYNYKYLLDVDGNTFSGRYLGLLRSGSLVFKATVFDEYFTKWIRPYEHYIPVKIDLSDLVEKVEWAITHEAEARQIQEMGMQFAQRVLTDAQNDCYFAAVLLEYARLVGYVRQE